MGVGQVSQGSFRSQEELIDSRNTRSCARESGKILSELGQVLDIT